MWVEKEVTSLVRTDSPHTTARQNKSLGDVENQRAILKRDSDGSERLYIPP